MIEYYLGEEPVLANVETYRLEEPDVCEWALERLDQLVLKPVDGSGGHGLVIGPQADDETLTALGRSDAARTRAAGSRRSRSRCRPRRRTSTTSMGPRHLDLRPFAINDGERVWVVPGGLTRVALPEGQPGRELEPGRRVQGHVGARVADRRSGAGARPRGARRRRSPTRRCARRTAVRCRPRASSNSSPGSSSSSSRVQQQQQ